MRTPRSIFSLINTLFVICFMLSSCSSTPTTTVTTTKVSGNKVTTQTIKEPMTVSLLGKIPARPYQVLGQAKISKYNTQGFKRQEATLRDLMRRNAASLGGDAIIDIRRNSGDVTGTVIAYKRILV